MSDIFFALGSIALFLALLPFFMMLLGGVFMFIIMCLVSVLDILGLSEGQK